jgi:uncharacterized repeat protein (TIGR01451 family)
LAGLTAIGVVGIGRAQAPLGPPPVMTPPSSMPQYPGGVPSPTATVYPSQPQQTPQPVTQTMPMPMPHMQRVATPVGAGVCIEKHCPESVGANQPLAYEIVVRNAGSTAVEQVRVEDEIPANCKYLSAEPAAEATAERLSWMLNTLEPGAERRIHVKLQPSGDGEISSTATVHYAATAGMKSRVMQPRLVLSVRGPEQVAPNENVPFNIMVTNPGSAPLTNLVLHCKLPEGLTHAQGQIVEAEIGTLKPGDSRNVTLTVKAVKSGQFTNELSATADGGLETSAKTSVEVVGTTLQLGRNGPARCYVKSEVGFELDVANSGPVPATYVELGDTLPAGLEFVSATDGGQYDPVHRTILWRLPALQTGAHQKVSYRVKAVGLGEMPDRAAARADRGPDARADGTFTVEGIAALALELVDLEDPIPVGADLTYEVRVVNQGTCPCTNIQIVCQVPDGLVAKEGTGPPAYKANGAEVVFEPLEKLATKADTVYRIKVKGATPGDYRFRVQMTCDQLRQPVMKEESSRVYKDGP